MKISVAMATYNGGAFLQEQLDSLAAQSRLPDEIVISDDGSSDDTLEIAHRFAGTVPFSVKIIQNDGPRGYAPNFNNALRHTTGDVIFLCDQDDSWFPDKLSWLSHQLVQDDDLHCVLNDTLLADADLNPVGISKMSQLKRQGRPLSDFVMGCCLAIDRQWLNLMLPIPDGMPAHDNWLLFITDGLGVAKRFEKPLQLYRRHGANASNVAENDLRKAFRPLFIVKNWARRGTQFRSSDNLLKELSMIDQAVARLDQRSDEFADIVGNESVVQYQKDLADQQTILRLRRTIRCAPLLKRPVLLLSLLKATNQHRPGVAGLMKDAVARRIAQT